ncbi:hypothetical protein KI387_003089, partial [Taxus chinensis]
GCQGSEVDGDDSSQSTPPASAFSDYCRHGGHSLSGHGRGMGRGDRYFDFLSDHQPVDR